MTRRLFLFAGYDAHGIIDESLIIYVRALAMHGDVIVVMDSDCPAHELRKLAPYTTHAAAARHGEYDFGSYKRAYTCARDAGILKNYDFVYMANDSMYGPLHPLGPVIERMENMHTDAFGMVAKRHKTRPHIQSWFIGMRASVFRTEWFDEFMTSITKLESKGLITRMYEQGFTRLVAAHGLTWGALWHVRNRGVYNNIKKLYRAGVPLMKKVAFRRRGGALGGQILYVLSHIEPSVKNAILSNARRVWGDEYIGWLLTHNPIKIIFRNIAYGMQKLFSGKI